LLKKSNVLQGGNPYINFLISAAVEIPAYALVLLVLNRLGRKIPLCCFMLIAGLALVVTIFIDKEQVQSKNQSEI
jgi:OCT family organic cation transporter-like MFS transporter 4/5